MASLVHQWSKQYDEVLTYADPRTKNWLFVPPGQAQLASVGYLLMVWLGPKLMKNRKPFNLQALMVAYNVLLVTLSAYMFVEFILATWFADYDYMCSTYNELSRHADKETRVINIYWVFLASKIVEFMDTAFMILRKKQNQVTFLHVFHHVSVLNIWWAVVLFIPGGQSYLSGVMNSLIHVIMYSYYALSAVPALRKYLWWKRYLTQLQLTQFVIIFTHITVSMFRGCDTPLWGHLLLFFYMLSLMVLFGNFYIKQYLQKRRGRAAAVADEDDDAPKTRSTRAVADSGSESSKKTANGKQQNGSSHENGHNLRKVKKDM